MICRDDFYHFQWKLHLFDNFWMFKTQNTENNYIYVKIYIYKKLKEAVEIYKDQTKNHSVFVKLFQKSGFWSLICGFPWVLWFHSLYREFSLSYKIRFRLLGQVYHFSLLICYSYLYKVYIICTPKCDTFGNSFFPLLSIMEYYKSNRWQMFYFIYPPFHSTRIVFPSFSNLVNVLHGYQSVQVRSSP